MLETKEKVLFIGLVWPEPASSAAGWRILHLVKLLLQDYEVHFVSAASKSPYSFPLTTLGVYEHPIELNNSSFDKFIQELQPDVVIFDRFMIEEQYGWRVSEQVPNALKILDTEDLHFLRLARQEAFRKNKPLDYHSPTAKREIAAILRCDLSLLISEFEMALLVETFKIDPAILFYLPFQEEKLSKNRSLLSYNERKDFVFIGNFIHEPNWRTVEILKHTIWPELRRRLPDAALHVYGAYASEKVNQLHKPSERFYIKGRAEDARATLEQYKVLLAPIPFGAGAKGKFVDAMFAGTPSVTTPVGAENMSQDDTWGGYITDDDKDFVQKAVDLYTDDNQWCKLQQLGFDIFNRTVADNTPSVHLLQWIVDARERLPFLRQQNFLGQILQQQQLNATKYMSLWIEQKNRLANTD